MKTWPCISTRPAFAAAETSARASASDVHIGFSSSTCLPASSASVASCTCVRAGVAMTTASTSLAPYEFFRGGDELDVAIEVRHVPPAIGGRVGGDDHARACGLAEDAHVVRAPVAEADHADADGFGQDLQIIITI